MSSRQQLSGDIAVVETFTPLELETKPTQKSSTQPETKNAETFNLEEATETFFDSFELDYEAASEVEASQTLDQIELYLPEPDVKGNEEQIELGGMPRPVFNILFEESDRAVEFYNAASLLESMEQQGVQVPYQCREGYCGACRTQLVKGKVTYLREPMAWLNDNEVLPCCCVPTSDIKLKLKG